MDISELDAFKLSDAVKFHNKLNPNLWINSKLDPEVRDQLIIIANDFVTSLGLNDLQIKDVTVSGSNAAYSYTPHSDLDLHVLVDMAKLRDDAVYRELFTAKKTLYNDSHDITVHGVPVELYVQDVNEPVKSLGEYSVLHDKWIRIPKKQRANFDQAATKAKFDNLVEIVELALKTKDLDKVEKAIATIKRYRKAGLDKAGEFGPENLAFKAIRKQGGIQDLYDLRDKLRSAKLSIEEAGMDEDYDPNGRPPGPEFKPTMPAGTVRVDVSDVYDWYKLGQHISNLDRVDPKIFGKGPPSTVMAFGTEPEEHEYINNLKKLGLSTTDIDPFDPNQPKSMPRQKVDPTYNVNETPRTFAPQETPMQKLVKEYVFFTSLGNVHIDKRGETAEAKQQLLALVQRLSKDSKTFANLDKQKMEANRDTILNHIHQMMTYAIPVLKKNLPADKWEAKRSQINAVLTAYNNTRQINEEQLDETVEENQIVNVVSNIAAAQIAKVMKAKESKLLALLDGGLSPKEKLELFGVKVKDLNVPNVNNPLLKKLFNILYIKVNSQVDFYDDPSAPKTLGGYYDGDYTVELFFPAIEYVAGKRESQLKAEIASTLAHEIQHAVDDYKSENAVYAGSNISPAKDMQGYLKLPYEVNARFQEATMDIAKFITMPKNDGSKTTQADLPELIRYAFEKNRLDKIYEKNQKEYKRLLTRAYKFFQAELNSPKKATPIPQNIAKRALNWILGKQTKEINEASGYIPSEKEKNDPRFKTALTVDVKPDSIKKNAKAFNWKTSRAGIPPQARADGKIAESLMNEWKAFLAEDEEQQELFPGYDEQHKQKRMDDWLQKTHAWDGHKPMVFYHATTKDFDTFNTHGTGFASALGMAFEVERHGSFFAVDPKFAESFIEKPDSPGEYKEGGRVLPVHLSVQNPIDLRDNNLSYMLRDEETVDGFKANDIDLNSIYNYISEYERWELFDGPEGAEFVENLQKLGFDGAIIVEMVPNDNNAKSGEVWVVFNPNQVKSINNRGSFSPDDTRLMRESITEGRSEDLFNRYGGRMMEFNQLPKSAKDSLLHYMTVEGDSPDFADELLFGYVNLPMDVLTQAVMAAPDNDFGEYEGDWDSYHKDYWSHEKDSDYASHLKDMWPVILDDGEGILDGWHRLHWYYRNGVKMVPALLLSDKG